MNGTAVNAHYQLAIKQVDDSNGVLSAWPWVLAETFYHAGLWHFVFTSYNALINCVSNLATG